MSLGVKVGRLGAELGQLVALTSLNLDAAEVGDGVAAACAQLPALTRSAKISTTTAAAAIGRRNERHDEGEEQQAHQSRPR